MGYFFVFLKRKKSFRNCLKLQELRSEKYDTNPPQKKNKGGGGIVFFFSRKPEVCLLKITFLTCLEVVELAELDTTHF